jgi:predicted metal-dependent hydrolase
MLAYEIAHTLTKRYTKKFWKVVETIYPNFKFKTGKKFLVKYGSDQK